MKKIITALLPVLTLLMSCQAKATVNKNLSISGAFDEIDATLGVTVIYTPASAVSVSVTAASQELYDRLEVKREGSTLRVGILDEDGLLKAKHGVKNDEIVVRVNAPDVTTFEASTGALIKMGAPLTSGRDYEFEVSTGAKVVADAIKAAKLSVEVSTGATVDLGGISAVTVHVKSSTGATATLAGRADNVDFDASTGAKINASSLTAREGEADCSTAGHVDCNVKSLDTDSSLGGKIRNSAN